MNDSIRRLEEGGAIRGHERSESRDPFPCLGPRKTVRPLRLAWRGDCAAVARLDPELANEILEGMARESWRRW